MAIPYDLETAPLVDYIRPVVSPIVTLKEYFTFLDEEAKNSLHREVKMVIDKPLLFCCDGGKLVPWYVNRDQLGTKASAIELASGTELRRSKLRHYWASPPNGGSFSFKVSKGEISVYITAPPSGKRASPRFGARSRATDGGRS